jgi:hypothetical protein
MGLPVKFLADVYFKSGHFEDREGNTVFWGGGGGAGVGERREEFGSGSYPITHIVVVVVVVVSNFRALLSWNKLFKYLSNLIS